MHFKFETIPTHSRSQDDDLPLYSISMTIYRYISNESECGCNMTKELPLRDGNRSKRSEQKGLLGSVRCFKVKARFGSMLDVLNRAPARFESSILKVLLGSIKLGPSCSIRLDTA